MTGKMVVAGRVLIDTGRCDLGECGRGTGALTPAPLALVRFTGKEPWLMLPWFSPLRTPRNAVQFATEQASA